ncbi:hypothetical protein Q3G72_021388 [Acer saccharum]|nr:hypothetical protein Q3G72_021388 [Acer saccharum]
MSFKKKRQLLMQSSSSRGNVLIWMLWYRDSSSSCKTPGLLSEDKFKFGVRKTKHDRRMREEPEGDEEWPMAICTPSCERRVSLLERDALYPCEAHVPPREGKGGTSCLAT